MQGVEVRPRVETVQKEQFLIYPHGIDLLCPDNPQDYISEVDSVHEMNSFMRLMQRVRSGYAIGPNLVNRLFYNDYNRDRAIGMPDAIYFDRYGNLTELWEFRNRKERNEVNKKLCRLETFVEEFYRRERMYMGRIHKNLPKSSRYPRSIHIPEPEEISVEFVLKKKHGESHPRHTRFKKVSFTVYFDPKPRYLPSESA